MRWPSHPHCDQRPPYMFLAPEGLREIIDHTHVQYNLAIVKMCYNHYVLLMYLWSEISVIVGFVRAEVYCTCESC